MLFIDWLFVILFFIVTLSVGLVVSKAAGKSESDFFLGGRSMPWWLLGFSMVATTYSTDTPNMVTESVRVNGIAGNWIWWGSIVGGMIMVFFFSRIWRRANLITDLEIYSIRYSGKTAKFLRGYRSLMIGIFNNIIAMCAVILAAMKIGGVMLDIPPFQCILWGMVLTTIFSCVSGFRGVIYTDFILFCMAMAGAIIAMFFAVDMEQVGGLGNLLSTLRGDPELAVKLGITPNYVPEDQWGIVFFLPVCIRWWVSDYGGSYNVQRMMAAKNEKHALGSVMFFNFMQYIVRPWPWILVALASLIVFPIDPPEERAKAEILYEQMMNAPETISIPEGYTATEYKRELYAVKTGVSSLSREFKALPEDKLGHDLAYSAMLRKLPHGWFGFVFATLLAAFVSTISTHLNWGASYLVNDFYKCTLRPQASQKELVWAGRLATIMLMMLAMFFSFFMQSALGVLKFLITFGLGAGFMMTLRWFWWRVNAASELTALLASIPISLIILTFYDKLFPGTWLGEYFILRSLLCILLTNLIALMVMLLTKPADEETLIAFYQRIRPPGAGWNAVRRMAEKRGMELPESDSKVGLSFLCVLLGCITLSTLLMGMGHLILGFYLIGISLTVVGLLAVFLLFLCWPKLTCS